MCELMCVNAGDLALTKTYFMAENPLPPAPAWVRFGALVIRRLPVGRYRAIDRICRHPPSAFAMAMSPDMGGYLFQCDLRDAITREVCFTGQYEPQETALIRAILSPGMCFVDVGANWGYYTLLGAHLVGASGRIVSLEPDPRLYSILKNNIARNELRQVLPLQIAAAANEATLQLAGYDESGDNFGVSRVVRHTSEQGHTFQVKGDCLDRILSDKQLRCVDLMKMDIEGAEGFAVQGLKNSLAERRVNRLLIELHPKQLAEVGYSMGALIDLFLSQGYKGFIVDHSEATTRKASYRKRVDVGSLLRPLTSLDQMDAWPHQLWIAPGVEPI